MRKISLFFIFFYFLFFFSGCNQFSASTPQILPSSGTSSSNESQINDITPTSLNLSQDLTRSPNAGSSGQVQSPSPSPTDNQLLNQLNQFEDLSLDPLLSRLESELK